MAISERRRPAARYRWLTTTGLALVLVAGLPNTERGKDTAPRPELHADAPAVTASLAFPPATAPRPDVLPSPGSGASPVAMPADIGAPEHARDDSAPAAQARSAAQSGAEPLTTASLPIPRTPQQSAPDTRPARRLDIQAIREVVDAYRGGRTIEADVQARRIGDPEVKTLLEWVAIRSQGAAAGFDRIAAFIVANPDYPGTAGFRRIAEATLISERRKPETVLAFFATREPSSPVGRIALARALKSTGKDKEAVALVRRSWLRDHLGIGLEKIVLDEFGGELTSTDHRLRSERYIFAGNSEAALRNAARVSKDYVVLARARLASGRAKGPISAKQIEAVPESQRKEISFAFLQAQQARRSDKAADAAKLMSGIPRDPALLGDGDGWWTERRLIARKLLDEGDAKSAYDVAAAHGAEDSVERIEAEWHAGWIALRFRQDAATAARHFAEAAKEAETPISVSRAAYWQGRASEALGREEEAKAFYTRAAEYPIAYYGQLARARLRLPDLPLQQSSGKAAAQPIGLEAARLLYSVEANDLGAAMLLDLARTLDDTPSLEGAAEIARGRRDARTLLAIGKIALQRGFPLHEAAFPTFGVPEFSVLGDPMERAIVHAIARQESAFDPAAVSPAGARGLMQMMPATARETARRAQLPFELERLTSDADYSARMGAAHLNDLIGEWRGSYVLTFAAYNAGSGNVRKWVAAYGDPRDPAVDAVDWVERIPFSETRNYVQRVMENLQVYRQRLNQRTAYLIDDDLKRAWRNRE